MMLEKIKLILEGYTEADPNNIIEETNLQADLDLNSLDVMNIVVEFEDTFGIEIPDEDVRKLVTVRDIMDYLRTHDVV